MPLLCAEHNTDGQLVAVSIPLAPTSEPSQATNPAMPPQVTSPVVTLTSPPGSQLGGFFFAPPPVCTARHLIASPILCMCHAAARSRHGANLAIGEGNQVNSKAPAAPRRYIGLRRA